MSPEILRRCLDARPFAAFLLQLTDQLDFRIETATEAKLVADDSALHISRPDLNMFIALDQIVSVSVDIPRSAPFGFGPRSKDRE
jgi:hypothetical protein